MNLTDGIEGLTEDQVAAINANAAKTYEGYESPEQIAGLKAAKDSLLAEKKKAEEESLIIRSQESRIKELEERIRVISSSVKRKMGSHFEDARESLDTIREVVRNTVRAVKTCNPELGRKLEEIEGCVNKR